MTIPHDPNVRRRPTIIASGWDPRRDGVIPLGMERVTLDIERGHLLVADLDPLRIESRIEFTSYGQPVLVDVEAISSTTVR
jgi:hypothetical protein